MQIEGRGILEREWWLGSPGNSPLGHLLKQPAMALRRCSIGRCEKKHKRVRNGVIGCLCNAFLRHLGGGVVSTYAHCSIDNVILGMPVSKFSIFDTQEIFERLFRNEHKQGIQSR